MGGHHRANSAAGAGGGAGGGGAARRRAARWPPWRPERLVHGSDSRMELLECLCSAVGGVGPWQGRRQRVATRRLHVEVLTSRVSSRPIFLSIDRRSVTGTRSPVRSKAAGARHTSEELENTLHIGPPPRPALGQLERTLTSGIKRSTPRPRPSLRHPSSAGAESFDFAPAPRASTRALAPPHRAYGPLPRPGARARGRSRLRAPPAAPPPPPRLAPPAAADLARGSQTSPPPLPPPPPRSRPRWARWTPRTSLPRPGRPRASATS
jgi:hypothetical protein